jgi:AraC-like DNA-binding protein
MSIATSCAVAKNVPNNSTRLEKNNFFISKLLYHKGKQSVLYSIDAPSALIDTIRSIYCLIRSKVGLNGYTYSSTDSKIDGMQDADFERTKKFLKEKILHALPVAGDFTPSIPGLTFFRRDTSNEGENCVYSPVVAVVIQGAKRSVIGNGEYQYGEDYCLIAGVDMPGISMVTKASKEKPLLSFSLVLDRHLIAQLLAETGNASGNNDPYTAVSLEKVQPDVLGAFGRLVDTIEKPEQMVILAPMIIREIHYRVLTGPQGGVLRTFGAIGTQGSRIAEAISWLRKNYAEPFSAGELANKVHMSLPTFNRYFRQVTSISPLQFQKRLRLLEAQRLMVAQGEDASRAAFAVGYESVTQFNREYKRFFGFPPRQDVNRRLQLNP